MPEPVKIKQIPQEFKDFLSKFDFSACMTCGTCSAGCPITGGEGSENLDIRKVLRMLNLGMVQEVVDSKFPWLCTGCGRCAEACPMDIDIPAITGYMKHLRPRDKVPGILHKGVEAVLKTGNNMSIPKMDYTFLMMDMSTEVQEEGLPGFYVPMDKKNADIAFYPNSKEVFADNDDMKWWWKIFYAARENWTVPSENWEAVDWGLFTGNYEATKILAQRKIDFVKSHNIKRMIMPDCGGGSYGCRNGMKVCELDDPENVVDFIYLYDYLVEIIKEGRIKIDKSVNAGKTFTWHDSCKHGRELERHFGHGYFDEPRWVLEQCVDDYVEMYPSKMSGNCCGAGGGMWPSPYEDDSAWHGRMKYDSIKNSGANVVVLGCSNCHDQIMKRLPKYYTDYEYEVKYLWEVVADSLVLEPWSAEEVAQAEKEAAAQWESFGLDPNEEY